MATLTIRNVPDHEREALRVRAAKNGRSMEAELRAILRDAITPSAKKEVDLATSIRRIVEPIGGIDLPEIARGPAREPPDFS
ncbi:FitA-like ribbon-helix-helix domain-containing protein [Fulvimarina manganoxydans]|nr:Arc family DNA-binding protein [Fulvimarina manganoxydans]